MNNIYDLTIDEDLDWDEYYVERYDGRILKGRVTEIFPDKYGICKYILVDNNGRQIKYLSPDVSRWDNAFSMSSMYKNKQDCREHKHMCVDNWEATLK